MKGKDIALFGGLGLLAYYVMKPKLTFGSETGGGTFILGEDGETSGGLLGGLDIFSGIGDMFTSIGDLLGSLPVPSGDSTGDGDDGLIDLDDLGLPDFDNLGLPDDDWTIDLNPFPETINVDIPTPWGVWNSIRWPWDIARDREIEEFMQTEKGQEIAADWAAYEEKYGLDEIGTFEDMLKFLEATDRLETPSLVADGEVILDTGQLQVIETESVLPDRPIRVLLDTETGDVLRTQNAYLRPAGYGQAVFIDGTFEGYMPVRDYSIQGAIDKLNRAGIRDISGNELSIDTKALQKFNIQYEKTHAAEIAQANADLLASGGIEVF